MAPVGLAHAAAVAGAAGSLLLAGGCTGPEGAFTALEPDAYTRQVLQADRPVVVYVHKALCPACLALAPTMAELSEEYAGRVTFLKVERTEAGDLRGMWGIRAYPTVLLFLGGAERNRWVYERRKAVYREALDAILAR